MLARAAVLLIVGAFGSACSDGVRAAPPSASGGSGGIAAAGGAGGVIDAPACDRPLPQATSTGLGPTCRDDEACGGERATCQTPPRRFGLRCVFDAECTRSGFFSCARGGLCAARCTSDAACPAFERCLDGRCQSRPCEDGVCPSGATCSAALTCEPLPCETSVATDNACGEQELCVAGDENFVCVPRPCTEDAICAPAGLCIGGGCRANVCACDADCGALALCIAGRCAREPGVCVKENSADPPD